MRKSLKNVLLLALLLGSTSAWAQKIDQRLTSLVEQVAKSRGHGAKPVDIAAVRKQIAVNMNADGTISSLSAIATLKKGAECPTEQLEQMGIKVRFVLGDMVALVIPTDKLSALEDVEAFSYVKADEVVRVMNEEARKETGVENVSTTAAATAQNLPKAFTGAGVVVGVIDGGIDFNHAAFRNADGTTRIKRAWDLKTHKDYTTEEQIKTLTCDEISSSHGTHTSAIAGGSLTGNGQQGMAPEADLYLCGVSALMPTTDVVECMTKIFKYAEEVKKPAVINLSLGSITGLHDGSDEYSKAAAVLTKNGTAKGRAVVISSANSAMNYQSIVKTLNASTKVAGDWQLATVLGAAKAPTTENINELTTYTSNYCIYAADYKDFELKLAMVDITNGDVMDFGKHVLNMENIPVNANDILKKETKYPAANGKTAIIYKMSFEQAPVYLDYSSYRLALFIKGSSDKQIINLICDGDNNLEACFDTPNAFGYDFAAAGYTKGNGDMTCNIGACSDNVISVGSYITRPQWTNYANNVIRYPKSALTEKVQELGEISDFSSYCVDDNGIPRPTIIAPGQGVISAINNYDTCYFDKTQAGVPITTSDGYVTLVNKVDKNNRTNWYAVEQGTSMSAPVTAGIVALWMQANPELSVKDIKDILKETCRNDAYTTDVTKIPSGNKVQAGLGKIDCLAGLKKILNTTAIETVAADARRQATPATMYNVDAPVYNMMGQRVGKSQKGIVIYKGRKYMNH